MIGIITATGERVRLFRQYTRADGVKIWRLFNDNREFPADEISFPPSEKEAFLRELYALLDKYNASIEWDCDPMSDLASIYDEHVRFNLNDRESIRFEGYSVETSDIKDRLK